MKKIVLIISIVIIVLAVLALLLFSPAFREAKAHLQGDMFKGDHITLDMNLVNNDNNMDISDLNMDCRDDLFRNHTVKNQNGVFATKGGVYGLHTFSLVVPAEYLNNRSDDLTIILDYYNTNDWYIVVIECHIELETTNNQYGYNIRIECKYNDGTHKEYSNYGIIDENVIREYFGR